MDGLRCPSLHKSNNELAGDWRVTSANCGNCANSGDPPSSKGDRRQTQPRLTKLAALLIW